MRLAETYKIKGMIANGADDKTIIKALSRHCTEDEIKEHIKHHKGARKKESRKKED